MSLHFLNLTICDLHPTFLSVRQPVLTYQSLDNYITHDPLQS
ncbi:7790_t:CDS:2 [Funneliformis mosseae]|uniref:7790_t:CDS:1 n=1 Tax=Funneliformis mosseae TaxID=27381 RepID=A0A9N8V3P7_FUNMO|nr:7790_t:CDS:2 [Funneliformis mosseae]